MFVLFKKKKKRKLFYKSPKRSLIFPNKIRKKSIAVNFVNDSTIREKRKYILLISEKISNLNINLYVKSTDICLLFLDNMSSNETNNGYE